MNALPPILNRDFRLPEDGKVHLVPLGEYPAWDPSRERTIVQVVDDVALDALLDHLHRQAAMPNFGGLCTDFDHFRHDTDKESRAAAWVLNAEKRPEGLFGPPRWTASGKAAVEGGDYRFISPEFDPSTLVPLGGDRFRVTRLAGFGLTNNPNMRGMKPLSNRRGAAAGGSPTNPGAEPTQTQPTTTMKKVTSLLGLADGADEDSIAGAIRGIQETAAKVTPLTNRVNELTLANETLVTEQIDADLDGHGVKDEETRRKLVPVLKPMKNRAERADFLKLIGKPAAAESGKEAKVPLTNRASAKTPEVDPAGGAVDNAADKQRAGVIANRARELRAGNKKLSVPESYSLAEAQVAAE